MRFPVLLFKGGCCVPFPLMNMSERLEQAATLGTLLASCEQRMTLDMGEARRLFHGRGRSLVGFEHVCVDRFHPFVLVTLFRPLDQGAEQALLAGLAERLEPRGMACLAVQRRGNGEASVEAVYGSLPRHPVAWERGLQYGLDPGRGQNLGFFLDMRLARDWLKGRVAGRSVLNLFAFTCAFSVVARAGGASRVVNIDLSRPSLAAGRENHRRNGLSLDEIYFFDHDIFRSWSKLHRYGRYDVVIMDPPTQQRGSFIAERDYAKVIRRFPKLLKDGADVLACLNAPHLGEDFLDEIFASELPGSVKVGRLPNPPEFADVDEQASLKVVHYRYTRPLEMPPLD